MAFRSSPTKLRCRSSKMMPALATQTLKSTAYTDSTTVPIITAPLSLPKNRCTWSPVAGKNQGGSMLSQTPRSTLFSKTRIALIPMACRPTKSKKFKSATTASSICTKDGSKMPVNSGPPLTNKLSSSK